MVKIIDVQTIEHKKYDVLVIGGGIAGIAAAVSALREGARVIPTCALTGEAAGKAAVRYIKKGSFLLD